MTHQYFSPNSNDPEHIRNCEVGNITMWLKDALKAFINYELTPEEQLEVFDGIEEEFNYLPKMKKQALKNFFKAKELENSMSSDKN
ncbi:hypothetical protein [Geminocystis sp. GBBB08]|uniref:hypothetical protein n=1 Tax=Geminocystis sp. GBBB08 TaxID=2604140 RepID=UPI0027E30E7B|nr:hypothetical protein [Geminocystis sp. GBBB08]MBL1210676.1 hypothetical protein [Geminocystis sp. GBBB08]